VMAATITLGIAPLLFVQVVYGRFFYSATIISGWNWLLIIPVVLVVYYLLYLVAMKKSLSPSSRLAFLGLAAVGFLYISYTLTLVSDLTEKPDLLPGLYAIYQGGFIFIPDTWEVLSRWLHILAGAMAVGGMFIQLLAVYHHDFHGDRELQKFGSRVFMHGVILATLLGLVYLFTLDSKLILAFLKSPGLHAVIGAIVLNIVALILNFQSVKDEHPQLKIWTSVVLVFAGIFCMVIARHSLRLIYLESRFDPAHLPINPQWSVFAMFLITFIAGLAILYWMIRKYYHLPRQSA
jgi:hypothetical protein